MSEFKSDAVPSGGDVNFKVPKNTHRKWKEPKHRPYTKEAAEAISRMMTAEYEQEKEKGFDAKDRESVINFQFDYCPLGDKLLVIKFTATKLHTVDGTKASNDDRFMVVEVGPEVSRPFMKGDLLILSDAMMANRKINGIKLLEIHAGDVAGILITKEEYVDRLMQFKELRAEEYMRYNQPNENPLKNWLNEKGELGTGIMEQLPNKYNAGRVNVKEELATFDPGDGEIKITEKVIITKVDTGEFHATGELGKPDGFGNTIAGLREENNESNKSEQDIQE